MEESAEVRSTKRRLSEKQIEAVLKLDGPDRYDHFVKQVVDWEVAWGLYDDGWAMGSDDDGTTTFPLWPAWEYAELCRGGFWSSYKPEAMPLEDLIEVLLPKLKNEGILASVFRTPDGQSVMPTIDQLLEDLKAEATRYE